MDNKDVIEYIYDKLFDNTLDDREIKIEKAIVDPELDYKEIRFSINGRQYTMTIG